MNKNNKKKNFIRVGNLIIDTDYIKSVSMSENDNTIILEHIDGRLYPKMRFPDYDIAQDNFCRIVEVLLRENNVENPVN